MAPFLAIASSLSTRLCLSDHRTGFLSLRQRFRPCNRRWYLFRLHPLRRSSMFRHYRPALSEFVARLRVQ